MIDAPGGAGGAGTGRSGGSGGTTTTTTSTTSSSSTTSTTTTPLPPELSMGRIEGWLESYEYLSLEQDVPVLSKTSIPVSGLVTFWSIASVDSQRGYFYGDNYETLVAHATDVGHVSAITDASAYVYEDWSVGPMGLGEIAIVAHPSTARYLAFRFDDIYPPDDPNSPYEAYADVTWYLSIGGDFSGFAGY
jgi:hypothetical protein